MSKSTHIVLSWLVVVFLALGCVQEKKAVRKDRSAEQKAAQQKADQAFDELDNEFEKSEPASKETKEVESDLRQQTGVDAGEASSDTTSSRYLTATGMGQTDAEARQMAKAELANIFQAEIKSRVLSKTKALTDGSGNESVQKSVEADLQVLSTVELKGVEISKTWYDEKSRSYYAEAALDRDKARQEWLAEIEKRNMKIDAELKRYRAMTSPLMQLQSVKAVMTAWLENQVFASRLRVIGYPAHEAGRDEIVRELFETASGLKDKMRLWVDVTGPYSDEVKEQIEKALTSEGFKLTATRKSADAVITVRVTAEPVKLNNPDYRFARGTVSLTLIDVASEAQVTEIGENVRKGHVVYEEAARKAVMHAAGAASEKLRNYFDI